MKEREKSPFATNAATPVKSPHPVKGNPHAPETTRGNDLRAGK